MKNLKRLFYYLLLNVFVSACTVVAVLVMWERTQGPLLRGVELASLGRPTATLEETAIQAAQATSNAAVLPTSTPTPEPTQPVVIITVQANQTLGEIAQEYGLDVDFLVRFNQLPNRDQISTGMQIFIPVTPAPTPTASLTPTPRLVDGTPSGPTGEARAVISSIIGVGDIKSERVFITRGGQGVLSLAGWKLRDEDGNEFVFPQLDLFEGGAVNIWSTSGTTTVVDLYWGLAASVWQSGEKAELRDAEGNLRASYTVP